MQITPGAAMLITSPVWYWMLRAKSNDEDAKTVLKTSALLTLRVPASVFYWRHFFYR